MLRFLEKEGYDKIINERSEKYWKKNVTRWKYMEKCIEIMKRYNPSKVLEMGTNGISLCLDSQTIGIDNKHKEDFFHDATIAPWPFKDKEYDFFVALQVFEHFDNKRKKQITAFNEAKRISKNILLSLPYNMKSNEIHKNIDDDVVYTWSSGIKADETYIFDINNNNVLRKLYFWKELE
jgi:hypothetical protein